MSNGIRNQTTIWDLEKSNVSFDAIDKYGHHNYCGDFAEDGTHAMILGAGFNRWDFWDFSDQNPDLLKRGIRCQRVVTFTRLDCLAGYELAFFTGPC